MFSHSCWRRPKAKGLAVYLAQPKELKVLQGWDHIPTNPQRTEGPAVTAPINCQTFGLPMDSLLLIPALRIFDS